MKISVGQGLLLLIAHYKSDKTKVDELKKLYLCGAEDNANRIIALLEDPILSHYQIADDPQTINNDPTRRYFETHLAYESLINGLNKLDQNDLEMHFNLLLSQVPSNDLVNLGHVLNGEFRETDNNMFKEYADYIAKIRSDTLFGHLLPIEKEKINLLINCTFLGVIICIIYNQFLPLNIYNTGIFTDNNRGRVLPQEQQTTRNQNLGIMKGHMPLAKDDIAYSDEIIPYLKPSDQSSFVNHAQFVVSNFNKLVHPFSNSISGTMLCQLRLHAYLRNYGWGIFTASAEKLSQYSQLLISAMLFGSGGHTLNEFTAIFSLDEVKREFSSTHDFDKISLASMFLTNNEKAFDQALEDTIDYNNAILLGEQLHAEIRALNQSNPSISAINQLFHDYEHGQKSQWFPFLRAGVKKSELITTGLDVVKSHLMNNDAISATHAIKQLKNNIEAQFGKTNFWGEKSESLKLVESVENELVYMKPFNTQFKDRMSKIKTINTEVAEEINGISVSKNE